MLIGLPNLHKPVTKTVTAYVDGCPDDWLGEHTADRWHTVAIVTVRDLAAFEAEICMLPPLAGEKEWRQWKASKNYKRNIKNIFLNHWRPINFAVNAYSFTEKDLKEIKQKLCEDLKLGFVEEKDIRGRTIMRHEYLSWETEPIKEGLHTLELPDFKILPLLATAWYMKQMYINLHKRYVTGYLCGQIHLDIVSDRLSGDTYTRTTGLDHLQRLLRYEELEMDVRNSPEGTETMGEKVADNVAGFLNMLINDAEMPIPPKLHYSLGWTQPVVSDVDGYLRGADMWDVLGSARSGS